MTNPAPSVRRLRAVALSTVLALGTPAALGQSAPERFGPRPDWPSHQSETLSLARVSVEGAMACASYAREGTLATRALVNYAYAGRRGELRYSQIGVCRMFHGRLRANEASTIQREIANAHPDEKNVVLLGVAAQD